jgi:ATP-dependent RNA helicase DDX5/DBP2
MMQTSGPDLQVLNQFNTNIMNEAKGVDSRIREFWLKHDIAVHGRDAPLPVLDMNGFSWPPAIQQALQSDGHSAPTPIQSQGWPIVLLDRDMVGVAQTGSGKTLCYVLPAFVRIAREGVQRGPKCVVLAPTRELAQQIQSVVRRYQFASSVCLYGGASRMPQMQALRNNNPQIIIATPGRMNDFVESSVVDLRTVDYLVLDEADRMLDMGFEPQIRRIIDQMPKERQTVMWSATWPKEVKALAAHYMRDYIQINVGGNELVANKNIEQIVEICEDFDKKAKLIEVLHRIKGESKDSKTLIFARTKQSVDYLTNGLQSKGFRAVSIHGDKSQAVRDRVLSGLSLSYP